VSPYRASAGFTERWEHFGYAEDGGVATVTFDRPERLNALTFEVYADLRDLLAELPHRGGVGALVLTGSGRGFCSGGDVHDIIGALQGAGPRELLDFTRMSGAVVQGLRELPLPVVAAVNGVAAGAGAVLALAADFRLLARSGSLQFLFTRVGLAGADMGAAYLLPRLVGLAQATELLLLGDPVDAGQAAALGLASRVVDDADLPAAAAELAGRLAAGPTLAYAATKVLLGRELDLPLAGALELEAITQALLMTSADHAEFYAAFTEGRSPRWTGR
jgi:enoyl-CoA hydratase/carnithine racemase